MPEGVDVLLPGMPMPDSLADAQASMLELERIGEYTLERFKKRRPETYQLCIRLLQQGDIGIRKIALLLKVGINTVIAVRDENRELVETGQRAHARIWSAVGQVVAEELLERVIDPKLAGEIAIRDLGIVGGIAVEKGELLAGRATARLAMEAQVDPDELNRYLNAIDVTADVTHYDAGAPEQKGPVDPLAPAAARSERPGEQGRIGTGAASEPTPEQAVHDYESEDSKRETLVNAGGNKP
jgi:hypothetical protein